MTSNFLFFIIPITLLTLTPGVDTMLVIRNTSRGGFIDGFSTSLGICSGLFFHALISTIGISVIILNSALAFSLLKIAGAGYLFILGAISLKDAFGKGIWPANNAVHLKNYRSFSFQKSFTEGFFCNILNPKAIVFYMAFLPQFIDPSKPAYIQTFFLTGTHFIIAMIWQGLLASLINKAKPILDKRRVKKSLNAVTGLVMMCFGVGLLIER